MKSLVIVQILLLMVITGSSPAQMGHGIMRGGHMMGNEGMREQESPAEPEAAPMATDHYQMMNSIKGMSRDMSGMLEQMSAVMAGMADRESPVVKARQDRMSTLMRDMSIEMNRMSHMMARGTASSEEIMAMQSRMKELQERMGDIQK